MASLIIICAILCAGIGYLIKYKLDHEASEFEITWLEYAGGVFLGCFILIPLIIWTGYGWAQASERQFTQYIKGWEQQALVQEITCTRDGPCRYCYDCDPYIVMVECMCSTDKDGHRSCSQCPETRYHDCPYVKTEYNYNVNTTLGMYSIDTHRFPMNPDSQRWRQNESVPSYIAERAGIGPSQPWLDAQKRILSGFPGPVTKRTSYENFLLASDATILAQYRGSIEKYKKSGMLPALNAKIDFPYHAQKAYFVAVSPPYRGSWQHELSYLNAAVGDLLQGDVHLVVVDAGRIDDPTEYLTAVKAHWQDTEEYRKNAFSKNGILVILGASDTQIKWVKAATGMPIGNDALIVAIEKNLKFMDLDVQKVLGQVRRAQKGGAVDWGNGVLSGVIRDHFKRIKMGGSGKDDPGFSYLARETRVSVGAQIFIVFLTTILSCGVWLAGAMIGTRNRQWRRTFHNSWR